MSSGEALESTTPGLGLTSRVASRLAWSLAALAVALCGLAVFASLVSLVEESLDRAGEAEAGAWLGSWTWVPLVLVPLAFLPVSFPHGRLLSPRWRVVPWWAGIGAVGFAFSRAFAAGPLHDDPEVVNPYGIEHVAVDVAGLGSLLVFGAVLVGGLSSVLHDRAGFWLALVATGLAALLAKPLRSRLQRRVNHFMYGSSDNGHAPAGGLRERLHEAFVPEAVELQRARERLVAAREEERRRLRRDLHDGLGPVLAGAALKLEAAENLLASRPGEAAELLELEISDDGQGLSDAYRAGVGIASMRERAEELGGTCEIERVDSRGTRVRASLPFAPT